MKQVRFISAALILASLFACLPQPPIDPTIVLPTAYMDAATALAADDFTKAKDALIALAKAANGNLQTSAHAAADSANIETMRESFKKLTEEVAVNMSYGDEYAVAFCPMYKGGTKWIQKREAPIANPYFGRSMQTCGSFVD